ncbi:hypothetical protein [Myceligenerans crystallogenes]|uniref:ATP synthase protein I n=1 Tax=Myceligenerans crystallogenes TaxID=316335 RepID=A0ABN2ND43_9MICO
MSETPAAPGPAETHGAERAVLRTALRYSGLLVAALAVAGSIVGFLVAGLPGLWGALLGAALAAFFSGVTVWSVARTVGKDPTTTGAVVMGSWIGKMVVLVVVLVLLRGQDFYDRVVLFVVLLIGAVGSALLDYRAVRGGRLPYVGS